MRHTRPQEIITEQATKEKASKQSKRTSYWISYLDISFSLLVSTRSSCYYYFFWTWQTQKMKPDLPVLQQIPLTQFVNEKVCSSQKQEEQHDLQTCLNNSFQLFTATLMSKFENLTNKVAEKVIHEPRLNGRGLGKVDNLMMGEQALNRHQIQKVNLKSR